MALPEIRRIAAAKKVPIGIVEKDLALTILLSRLAESDLAPRLAFKGGTAIKMLYFPDARFSVDLDFNLLGVEPGEVKQKVRRMVLSSPEGFNFGDIIEARSTPDSFLFRVPFTGPLEHKDSVRFDFSRRERPLRPLLSLPVKDRYGILANPVRMQALDLAEIFAEKIRALLQTEQPRHLYDLWFLLRERPGILDSDLARANLSPHGLSLDARHLDPALARVEPVWERDLVQLLADVPDFSAVSGEVRAKVISGSG